MGKQEKRSARDARARGLLHEGVRQVDMEYWQRLPDRPPYRWLPLGWATLMGAGLDRLGKDLILGYEGTEV